MHCRVLMWVPVSEHPWDNQIKNVEIQDEYDNGGKVQTLCYMNTTLIMFTRLSGPGAMIRETSAVVGVGHNVKVFCFSLRMITMATCRHFHWPQDSILYDDLFPLHQALYIYFNLPKFYTLPKQISEGSQIPSDKQLLTVSLCLNLKHVIYLEIKYNPQYSATK